MKKIQCKVSRAILFQQIIAVEQMAVHRLILLRIILLLFLAPIIASQLLCPDECGDVSIDYPFGIGEGCYFDKSFEVICNNSSHSSKAILKSSKLEISSVISFLRSGPYFAINISVISLNTGKSTGNTKGVNLSGGPFSFSQRRNKFAAIGCHNFSMINNLRNNDSTKFGACFAICTCDPTQSENAGCCDFLCDIPPNSKVFNANTAHNYSQSIPKACTSVSMVEKNWLFSEYKKNSSVLRDEGKAPAVLEWGQFGGFCLEDFNSGNKSCNKDNYCLKQLGSGYICLCERYRDICEGTLICNTTGGNKCSQCPQGYYPDPSFSNDREPVYYSDPSFPNEREPLYYSYPSFSNDQEPLYCRPLATYDSLVGKRSRVKFIVIGCTSGGLGMLLLIIGAWWLYKFVKRRREMKRKQKFFKRNGGLLLQQELSTNECNIEKTKVFTSKDLERATDNFNSNRILGQGGQGTVYKGMLEDGRIVAVKKSKVVDESKVEEFINEVVILSQINHRNVVKLIGCCLETEVPLLVYEFISNGNLFEYMHHQIQEFPITWKMFLRIAVEVSGAISYLHSAASIPIYHRDIKSTNILLDDKYRAKVSDFGTSRSMAVDKTHLTTQVHGTFGYLDPEYFRSSQFTEKSDVYSFGVVLAELLTREKPIRLIDSEEDRSLAAYFLSAMKEDRLFEILDVQVLKEAEKNEIITVANLAKRCLNLNGKKRPTMKEIATELAGITTGNEASIMQEVIDSEAVDITSSKHFETGSSFYGTGSFVDSNTFSVDVDPLISNKW